MHFAQFSDTGIKVEPRGVNLYIPLGETDIEKLRESAKGRSLEIAIAEASHD